MLSLPKLEVVLYSAPILVNEIICFDISSFILTKLFNQNCDLKTRIVIPSYWSLGELEEANQIQIIKCMPCKS